MSFQPLIGAGGYNGWKFVSRTLDAQRNKIAQDASVSRDLSIFRERIATVKEADDLASDYSLLKTALSAFGLEADLNKRFFIRKVLESYLADPKSLVNRLSDKRYRAFAEAFGLGPGGKMAAGLADTVAARHIAAEFERRVGTMDGNLRLALNAARELPVLAKSGATENTKWYSILGSLPLRKVFEGALGLAADFGKLPIDRQRDEMSDRLHAFLGSGSPATLSAPENLEKLIGRFLIRAEATNPAQASYNAALVLLSS